MKELYAPELDRYLRVLEVRNLNSQSCSKKTKVKINELYEVMDLIEPQPYGDNLKILYFTVPRGDITHYGNYEELKKDGEVKSYKEFEKFFQEDYPDSLYWYKLVVTSNENYRVVSVNRNLIVYTNLDDELPYDIPYLNDLLDFIIVKAKKSIKLMKDGIYNDYVKNNLSFKNRFGVIKRSDYWNIYPEVEKELYEKINENEISDFVKYARSKTEDRIKEMNASMYFEWVKIALEAIGYEVSNMAAKEVYLKYADGRDNGLSSLSDLDYEAFANWYLDNQWHFDHTFEIVPGYSFSRINLMVLKDELGYFLAMSDVILCHVEIAKIYLALHSKSIPIIIYNVDALKKALLGEDYLGMVPEDVFLANCENYFVGPYKPRQFIHTDKTLLNHIIWENIEKSKLKDIN